MYTQYRFQPECAARVVPDSWIDSGTHQEMGGGNESYYAILLNPGHRIGYEVNERTGDVINGAFDEETVLRTLYIRRDGAGAFEWDTPAIVDTSGENTSYRPHEFVAVMARASDAGDPVPQQRQQQYRELVVDLHDINGDYFETIEAQIGQAALFPVPESERGIDRELTEANNGGDGQ